MQKVFFPSFYSISNAATLNKSPLLCKCQRRASKLNTVALKSAEGSIVCTKIEQSAARERGIQRYQGEVLP